MSVSAERLRFFIDRLERLQGEQDELKDQVKDVKAEAKSEGFDLKTIQAVLKLRRKPKHQRSEEEDLLATYLAALGMD